MIKEINIIDKRQDNQIEFSTSWLMQHFDEEPFKLHTYKDQYGYTFWEVEVIKEHTIEKDESIGIMEDILVEKGRRTLFHEKWDKIQLR